MNLESRKKYHELQASGNFAKEKLDMIYEACELDLDVDILADANFNLLQMQEVLWGLKQRLPVQLYANHEYNSNKMRILRSSLEFGLNYDNLNMLANQYHDAPKLKREIAILYQKRELEKLSEKTLFDKNSTKIRAITEENFNAILDDIKEKMYAIFDELTNELKMFENFETKESIIEKYSEKISQIK